MSRQKKYDLFTEQDQNAPKAQIFKKEACEIVLEKMWGWQLANS